MTPDEIAERYADQTFRDEQSVLVEIPEHIDGVFRENLKRFEAQPSTHDNQ
jgi:hypothetical protein